jgi:hypothetical protein
MRVVIDESVEFVWPSFFFYRGGWERVSDEKSNFGNDGVLSVDGGFRKRELSLSGRFRGVSNVKINEKRDQLERLNDGREHKLEYCGEMFEHLRVDSMEIEKISINGVGYECKFKIIFSQLRKV